MKHADYNEADEDNKTKPFYKANVIQDDGNSAQLKIAPVEQCLEPKFMKPFTLEAELIMDYSEMADKGI